MLLASTYAGMAFTRANVGYVHAIAHQFGGRYHTPHGLANAIVLPHVLRFSAAGGDGPAGRGWPCERGWVMVKRGRRGAGQTFIDGVVALERDIGMPTTWPHCGEADIPALAKAALHEAHTGYPVPRYLTQRRVRAADPPAVLPPARPQAAKGHEDTVQPDRRRDKAPEGQRQDRRHQDPAPTKCRTAHRPVRPHQDRRHARRSRKTPPARLPPARAAT
jgi:hypothetical protein